MNPQARTLAVLTSLLICALPAHAGDCGNDPDPCGKRTGWNDFESMHLQAKAPGTNSTGHYTLRSSRKNGDMEVEIDLRNTKAPQKGTILMVEGAIMVSKGLQFSPGREIDALDEPMLYMILAGKTLSRVLPAGPESIVGKKPFQHEDRKTGIQFATPSAQGFIPPPWSASGFVQKNADGSVDFDLVVKWHGADQKQADSPTAMVLSGQLKRDADFRIDSSMSLAGWKVFGVGPIVEKAADGTRYDYGATPLVAKPATIADIRNAIALENSPGEVDLTMNFGGFWKEKCTATFGLRIKPVDTPGMYTITFCGPGGCGNEENLRKTFIKGDKRYLIVSATELQVGSEGKRSTYLKCSDKMLP